jgi:GNAT superfamily N-acetyltransferase
MGEAGKDTKPETQNSKHSFDRLRAGQPPTELTFRFMLDGEESDVCGLVHRAFSRSVAPLYTKKGAHNFEKYADPGEMHRRVNSDHVVLVALAGGDLAGMIELRRNSHISLLFVEPKYQGKGIGSDLLGLAIKICRTEIPGLKVVTVNSSPNAVRAYESMGFKSTGVEQSINGVRSVPMDKELTE